MIYYLGLGSNIGNLEQNLKLALDEISQVSNIIKTSRFHESKPWGYENQNYFLNAVLSVDSEIKPQIFLTILKEIENKLGKVVLYRWGPRIIDIDILFCDNLIITTDELIIPHQHAHEREFVLKPMCEIAPDFVHPVLKKTISELANLL